MDFFSCLGHSSSVGFGVVWLSFGFVCFGDSGNFLLAVLSLCVFVLSFSVKYLDCIKNCWSEFCTDSFLVCYFYMIIYQEKTPTPKPVKNMKALRVLTVKYCLSFPGAYVKWSGKTDTEEIMYFLWAFSNDKCSCLSREFLTKCWFLQANRISISSIFFYSAANQKLYLLHLLDNWKFIYQKFPTVPLIFNTLF